MYSLFSTTERSPQPLSNGDEIPEHVRGNFALLLDLFTPNIFVCWIILGVNILVFVAMLLSGFNPDKATPQTLLSWGADYGPLTVTGGQWWRVFTSAFVHLGFLHVGFNMFVLYQIGPFMERLLGNIGFLIVYSIAGVAGSICSLALNPYVISAGASGAIFGLYGALIGFLILRRDSIPAPVLKSILKSAVIFLVYNAVFGVLRSGTDLAAHGGGLIAGLICGLAVSTPVNAGFRERRIVRATAAGLGCALVLTVLATLLPRPMDFQAELSRLSKVESQAWAAYAVIFGGRQIGGEADLANRLEASVIRPWHLEREAVARFHGLPTKQQHVAAVMLAYMDARERGWRNIAQGLRTKNPQLVAQGVDQQKGAMEQVRGDLRK